LANGITVTGESLNITGVGTDFNGALQAAASATATWAGPVVLNTSARVGTGIGGTLTISGAISSGTEPSLLVSAGAGGTGTVIVSAASGNNTYTGNTTIFRGVLQLGADDTLPTGTTLDVDGSSAAEDSTFDLNNFNQTVARLQRTDTGGGAGGSFVTNTGANLKTLTVNQSTTSTYNGIIQGNLALTKSNTGSLTLTGVNTYSGATTISAGTLQIGNGGTAGTLGAGNVTNDSSLIFNRSDAVSVTNIIGGTGNVTKNGAGTTTLTANNSYTGNTTVNDGQLIVTGSLASNLLSKNFIAAPDDSLTDNPILTRRILNTGNYSNYGSSSNGGLNSTAELLAGVVVGTGPDNADVSMSWRTRTSGETTGSGTPRLISNILDLDGVAIVSGSGPTALRDLFVLQMSYDDSAAPAGPTDIYLATLSGGSWVNATATNTGNNASGAQLGYVGDFASFQTAYGTNLSTYIGAYGVDLGTKKAWAVLNHNTEFAVIPEPTTLVAGALGMLGIAFAGLRRRRNKIS
jgi:autotransporter-associated beta strand protein